MPAEIKRKLIAMNEQSSFGYVEAYKALRANLQYLLSESTNGNVIMVTSSIPGEGKSNVSINLAYSLAQDGKKVVLVDCDLRKGLLHQYLEIPALTLGLSNMLIDQNAEAKCKVYTMGKYGFQFIPCGTLPSNPSEIIGSERMGTILRSLSSNYDYVICDSAPVNAVADSTILARFVDGVILVVSHNEVKKKTVLLAKERLENVNANILGVVLNKFDGRKTGEYSSDDYSYYNYYGDRKYGKDVG